GWPVVLHGKERDGIKSGHLNTLNGRILIIQVRETVLQALPDQVTTATGLKLGYEALVGAPELITVIRRRHPGHHTLPDRKREGQRGWRGRGTKRVERGRKRKEREGGEGGREHKSKEGEPSCFLKEATTPARLLKLAL